jgi:hypothetical protein
MKKVYCPRTEEKSLNIPAWISLNYDHCWQETLITMRILQISICLLVLLLSNAVTAQNSQVSDRYHPFLSDTFNLGIGAFQTQKNFDIQVDGSSPGDDIDFDEALGLEDSETSLTINFRWRYTDNWSLFGQYWAISSGGGAVLEENTEWNDVVFKKGTFANAGVDTTILRIFFGRSFLKNSPGQELGVGLGLHWMEIDAFIEGEAITDITTEFRHESVSASVPLPNIGAWYLYSWSPKWAAQARVDWLSVTVGDYSGGLLGGMVGVNYQISGAVGLGLSYNVFGIDVDAKGEDLRGRIETHQDGPRLSLTATW